MQSHNRRGLMPLESPLGRRRCWTLYHLAERNRLWARDKSSCPAPAVTISYETGSGEQEVARHLAGVLQASEQDSEQNKAARWRVLDRQLVEETLVELHLPKTLARLMPEDGRSYVEEVMEELVGLRPPSWIVVPRVSERIRRLAHEGHVILIGRGATFVTAAMPNVLHVRLIASLSRRVTRVQKLKGLTPREAARFVTLADRGRSRYAKAHFHARLENELNYHYVINTDVIPCVGAAHLIADTVRSRFGVSRARG